MCTRELDGVAVEFGTTGYTMDDVFVLYDRTSHSVWYPTQSFEAVSGERQGESIEILDEPSPVALGEWLDEHPGSLVMLPTAEDLERRREMWNRPYMGVQLGEREDGLYADSVMADTPAAAAGLEDGDRILEIDGAEIDSRAELSAFLSDHSIGDTIEIVVSRGGREVDISLTLGRRR